MLKRHKKLLREAKLDKAEASPGADVMCNFGDDDWWPGRIDGVIREHGLIAVIPQGASSPTTFDPDDVRWSEI